MHFLCLHGIGTNGKVFELQTLPLRYALSPSATNKHTFDFVDAEHPHPPDPSLASLVSASETLTYYIPSSGRSLLATLSDLDALIAEADPPYDALLGFSQGSTLAATLLTRPGGARHPFKLAVFLSAGTAADYEALQRDEVVPRRVDEGCIKIPTAHVYASNDDVAPGQGEALMRMCDARAGRFVAVHRLGHRVPGAAAGEKGDLDRAVEAVKQGIAKAETFM